ALIVSRIRYPGFCSTHRPAPDVPARRAIHGHGGLRLYLSERFAARRRGSLPAAAIVPSLPTVPARPIQRAAPAHARPRALHSRAAVFPGLGLPAGAALRGVFLALRVEPLRPRVAARPAAARPAVALPRPSQPRLARFGRGAALPQLVLRLSNR